MEGVAFSLRHNLEVAEAAGAKAEVLRAMGGSANSLLWTQIKADVTGKAVVVPASDTATTLGAAILAGVGVGFENHGGRTCINNCKPLGKVLYGSGNDGKTGYEGVVYKNVIGTYLHGPLLPKNPQLADWLIAHALEQKYGKEVRLAPLDDTEEKAANDYVYHRFVKEN